MLLLTFEMIVWIALVSTPPEQGRWIERRYCLIDQLRVAAISTVFSNTAVRLTANLSRSGGILCWY